MIRKRSPRSGCISIVSDHPLAAHTLKQLLQSGTTWRIDTHSFLSFLTPSSIAWPESVVIVDKGASSHSFKTHLRTIKSTRPMLRIIVVDHPQPPEEECLLLLLGAHGLVTYDKVREKLKPAIRTVQSGQFWFKPESIHNFAQYLNRRIRGERSSSGSLLTVREQEIVCLIKRGLLTRQIATELGISDSTVKFHVSHILDKLGMKHRREVLAFSNSDISPEQPAPDRKVVEGTVGTPRLAIIGR